MGIKFFLLLDKPILPVRCSDWSISTQHLAGISDFARELMDDYIVPDRGEVVIAGAASDMVEANVRRYLTV